MTSAPVFGPDAEQTRRCLPNSAILTLQGYGSNSTLFASVYATDALGAASRSTFGVIVTPYEGGVQDLSDAVGGAARAALEAGDTDAVMQVRQFKQPL